MAERKRGNGEGSKPCKRSDGRWEARYYGIDGKRRTVYAKTRKEVSAKLMAAMANREQEPEPISELTFRQFIEQQYDDVARDTMKRRSYETYRTVARKYLLPTFGKLNLSDVQREQVQRMYSRLRNSGLSAARVRRIHGVLSAILNTAVRWRYLQHNVCKEVSPPRVPQPDIRPLSLDEAKLFLEAAKSDERYHALYVLGVTTGARFGELAGLDWNSLDLDNKTMRVRRTLVKGNGGYSFDTPKTTGSMRTVRLTVRACEALRNHRKYQAMHGIPADGDALVFSNSAGSPVNHSHFTRRHFKPLLKRAGLPETNWHAATRHTATCLLLLDRVDPKSICNMMGWSSVAFMLTNYARFLPDWGDGGAMDRILS